MRAFCLPMHIDIIQRICETGPIYASLQELITAVVGDAEVASTILAKYPTVLEMAGAHAQELQELPGIGQATATRFKAPLNWDGACLWQRPRIASWCVRQQTPRISCSVR